MAMELIYPLVSKLKLMRRWFNFVKINRNIVRCFFYGLILSFLFLSTGKLVPSLNHAYRIVSYILIMSILIAVFSVLLRRVSLSYMAILADQRADLKERLSSAVEFAASKKKSEFIRAQLEDATFHSEKIRTSAFYPFSLPREAKFIPVVLVFIVGLHFVPVYQSASYQEKIETVRVLKKESKRIEKVAEELKKKAEEAGCEEIKKISHEAKKVSELMLNPRVSRREAIARVSELEDKLRQEKITSKEFKDIVREMERSELTKEIARDLSKGNVAKAQAQLKDLAKRLEKGQLSVKELKELKQSLESGAKTLTGISPMKASLVKATAALKSGDNISGAEALDKISEEFDRMSSASLVDEKDLEKALAQLDEGRRQIGEKAVCPYCGKASGYDESSACQACGQGGKKAMVLLSGRKESGPEWGVGSTNIEGGTYEVKKRDNFGKRLSSDKSGRQEEYVRLYAPERIKVTTKDEKVKGQIGKGPILGTIEIETTPSLTERSYLPYADVYYDYRREAEEAIYRQEIPAGYRELVKKYFEEIEPEKEKQ